MSTESYGYRIWNDWLVADVNGCTCFGGDAHYGHENGCGSEPCGQWPLEVNQQKIEGGKVVDNFVDNDPVLNLTCLWDMSDMYKPMPVSKPYGYDKQRIKLEEAF